MQKDIYERHIHADPDLPLLFFDGLTTQRSPINICTGTKILKFCSLSKIPELFSAMASALKHRPEMW